MARPPESPIDISSNSPTPTRPILSLPRRSSSRLHDTHEPIGAAVSHSRTRQVVPEEDEEVMPVPPPRRRDPYSLPPASHRPASNHHRPAFPRHGLAIPTAAVAGPSRAAEVIDLTEDDDDDIEFTGEAPIPATRRVAADPRLHQRQRGTEIRARIAAETERHRQFARQGQGHEAYDVNAWRDLNQIDQVVEDRRRAAEALWDDQEVVVDPPNPVARDNALATLRQRHRRQVERYHRDHDFSPPPPPPPNDPPPPPPPRARIGLGGAVLRRGNQQINYGTALPPRRPEPYPAADIPQFEARLQERVDRVRRAREAQHAEHPGMIANIVQNLMNGGDPNGERMEALLNRLRPAGVGRFIPGLHPGNQAALEDPAVIIARLPMPDALDLPDGFTSDFDLNDTIEIDQPKHAKRFMACTRCGDPLYINDGQKSQDDRVWGLRCGHLIDQKCLLEISSPQVEDDRLNIIRPPPGGLDILGKEGGKVKKRGYKRKASKRTTNEPVEYEWKCPVESCGWGHVSVLNEAEWKQDEEEGAVQLYV